MHTGSALYFDLFPSIFYNLSQRLPHLKLKTETQKAKNAMSSTAVVRNIIANFMQFGLRLFIGIWFTRFLIRNLGTEVYGLLPLAWNLTSYFELMTLIINAPAGRYMIIEKSRGNLDGANKIFNTVFWGLCGLSAIVLLIGAIISWSSPLIFNVPSGHEMDARLIFLAVSGAFVITTFSNPLSLSTYITNRLDLRSLNDSFQLIVRVGSAYCLIYLLNWKLGAVSAGVLMAATIGLFVTIVLWRRLTPWLTIKKPAIDRPLLNDIAGMGGWMFITQIGSLLFLNTELFIVNFLYGADATGRYGALLLFTGMLRSSSELISSTLTPPVIDRYAREDVSGVIRMVCRANCLLGIIIALPVGLICGFSAPLLKIWLGPEFVNLYPVLIVLTAHLCLNLAILPVFSISLMAKKVKVPGIVTIITGIINVLLAVSLGWPGAGLGLLGVALAGAIVLTIKNSIFSPIYAAHILKERRWLFYPSMLKGIGGFLIILLSAFVVLRVFEVNNLFQLLAAFACVSLGYMIIAWFVLLNKEDKSWLLNLSRNLIGLNEQVSNI